MDVARLRAEFPALARLAYLNAGTDGPLPAKAALASAEELRREVEEGREQTHFRRREALSGELRDAYSLALGCDPADVALTTGTSEGIAQVIGGLEFDPGDEIVTSDEEHPGLLGALSAARELRGVSILVVPLSGVASAVGPRTRLIACSHVSWVSGCIAPAELKEARVPVLLDGAQGVGAVPVDVDALACDAYAGAGQKWLCGPDGIGMLYVSPALRERLRPARRGYSNLLDPDAGLDAQLCDDARCLDAMSISAEAIACALAGVRVLESAGLAAVHERALSLANRLATSLSEQGHAVLPRGNSTLVSFESPDAELKRTRLAENGVILRNIPGKPWLRASVGAWNDEGDLDRLLRALST